MNTPPRQRGGTGFRDITSRRYTLEIAALGRCRSVVLLDSDLDPALAKDALHQIDALLVTLGSLKRQKERGESEGDSGTEDETP